MEAALKKKKEYARENRISFLQMYVNHCVGLAARSPDPSTKVGCVIIDKECRLLAQGFNGEITAGKVRSGVIDKNMKSFKDVVKTHVKPSSAPAADQTMLSVCSNPLCTVHISVKTDTLNASIAHDAARSEAKKLGVEELPPLPFQLEEVKSSKGADGAIHAEMNALLHARCGRDELKGAIAIVSLMPCPQCFKLLAQSGISYVIILSDSGRYIDTLRLIESLGSSAPLVVPLDLIVPYIDVEDCLPTKVFKSKLVPFIEPSTSSSSSSTSKKRKHAAADRTLSEPLPAHFDYDYDTIVFKPSIDVADKSLDALFRILFKLPPP